MMIKNIINIRHPLRLLILSFSLLAIGFIVSHLYNTKQIRSLQVITERIYEHPLVVSNASLGAKYSLYAIKNKIEASANSIDIKKIEKNKEELKGHLLVIEKDILGEEGKALSSKANELFKLLDKSLKNMMKRKSGSTQMLLNSYTQLNLLLDEIHIYARDKASEFVAQAEVSIEDISNLDFIINIIILLLFTLVSGYTVKHIKYHLLSEIEYKKEIESQKQQYEFAINGTRDGLWDWNLISNKVYFSPQWKAMLGYKDNELPNVFDTWLNRVHPDDLEQALKDIDDNNKSITELYSNIHRLKHKDGTWVWIHDRGHTAFDENNKAYRMGGFHTDISKEKELETTLHEQEELLIVQSRYAAMGEMIGMIAHQWRQPIAVIAMGANNMLADIALENIDAEAFEKQAGYMLEQTEYLSNTIDDFRNFFRSNKRKERVLVKDIMNETLEIMNKSFDSHEIEIVFEFLNTTEVNIFSRELLQVYINIIKNAKEALTDYRDSGRQLSIEIYEDESSVVTKICNNGGHIGSNILKVFDPYFSTKEDKNGTGLGLYMSKTIIEKHLHGSLEVEDLNEDKVCFTITLAKERSHE